MVSRSKVDWLTEDTIEANIKNEKIKASVNNKPSHSWSFHFVVLQNQGRKCQKMHAVARATSLFFMLMHINVNNYRYCRGFYPKTLFSRSSNGVHYTKELSI